MLRPEVESKKVGVVGTISVSFSPEPDVHLFSALVSI